MARMLKGELGLRVEVWRSGLRMHQHGRQQEMMAALEAQMRAQGQGAGVRQLRQIMYRMVKGEKGMRLEVWRTGMKDAHRVREVERLQRDTCGSIHRSIFVSRMSFAARESLS